jgi:hypothetical protein
MAIIDDFKSRFPEFDPADVDAKLPDIEAAYQCYYGGAYTNCNKEIILMLMAHLLADELSTNVGGIKSTTSKSVGNVSVGFGSATANTGDRLAYYFGATKYGKRFMLLTSKGIGGHFV